MTDAIPTRYSIKTAKALAAFAVLAVAAGCGDGSAPDVTRAAAPALDVTMQDGTQSVLIEGLLNRRSVLQPGPMRDVAGAVMDANARAAEADLRAAVLRSEARALNWLPTLGPQVSLTSLGAVVTSLVVNQAIVDYGARRAERDFARYDVEVAAVALAEDSNARVLQALDLYLRAQQARARAAVARDGLQTLEHFAWVMGERVNAGISDRADLAVVTQRQAQMRSDMEADLETATSAMRELQAMSARDLSGTTGLSPLAAPSPTAVALSVMKARAESERAVAGARSARAGFLPGLSLGGDVTNGGGVGLTAGAGQALGLGTGAAIRAVEAERTAAAARVGQQEEQAARTIAALEGELASLRRQQTEARRLADQAAANYDLFAEQQRAGQRGVPETVGVFETRIRAERAAVEIGFDIALLELRIAAELGTLVDGDRI